jgi:hypothetical protein
VAQEWVVARWDAAWVAIQWVAEDVLSKTYITLKNLNLLTVGWDFFYMFVIL